MNRSIKFKLKNGKTVTMRRVRGTDYDNMMIFFDKFSRDTGAVYTLEYAGQPKKDKTRCINIYESEHTLTVGVWDGNKIIGQCSVVKINPTHPYYMGKSAKIGFMILNKYTHNGIGSKMLEIAEKWARQNDVNKLWAEIRHKNITSLATFIKQDFLITGIQYNVVFINGRWMHEYIVEKILD